MFLNRSIIGATFLRSCLVKNSSTTKICNKIKCSIESRPFSADIPKTSYEHTAEAITNNENNTTSEVSKSNNESSKSGDRELEHKLKVLMLEAEVLRQQGFLVPDESYMKDDMWQHLVELPTISSRKKYLEFLFKLSKKQEHRKIKQVEKQKKLDEFRATNPLEGLNVLTIEEHASQYGLKYNNMFLRFYDTIINRTYNHKLFQAMMFGQKLVIDCGYEQHMTKRENSYCAKQLMLLFAENRFHSDPFDIHYTNYNRNSDLAKLFHKSIPTLYNPEFPANIHENSYLNVFPKEKLIYLTPHCREEMVSFDHEAIYIIGGIVDKINNEPLSMAKAKREGIKMLKFPLDKYLLWGSGSGKSLTLNQCVAVLLDIKKTGDWKYALRHVPKRKLAEVIVDKHVSKFKPDFPVKKNNTYNTKKTWKPK